MERLAAFERMLSDIQKQSEFEKEQMEKLKAQGKEKSATSSVFWKSYALQNDLGKV